MNYKTTIGALALFASVSSFVNAQSSSAPAGSTTPTPAPSAPAKKESSMQENSPSTAKAGDFRVPRSTLDAIERKLIEEKNPHVRVQLILRWVKNKEEYEQGLLQKTQQQRFGQVQQKNSTTAAAPNSEQLDLFRGYKRAIIDRIHDEIADLERSADVDVDPLYHVLGFRYLEVQKYKDATAAFEKIRKPTFEDSMGMGDSLFQSGDTKRALEYYERGGRDLKFRNTAGYKRAWCFMQASDFKSALVEFDVAMEENPFNSIKLKEESFRDRLRPYVETYDKISFDEEEIAKLKSLAGRVHSQEPAKAKELVTNGLKTLIQHFNAKAQVEKAQAVFAFLAKEIPDATAVLIMAAPLWIKVHRGQLNHEQVKKIIETLPAKAPEGMDIGPLQTELYNSVVFYDTLFKEDANTDNRKLLFLMNKKYFQMFPDDTNADSLRVGYAKLLLEEGDPAECIDILARRKGGNKEIDDMAMSIDAKCQLKQLDQLYAQEHTEFFYAKLRQTLLEKKIYERSDLGLTSEAAFESISRMLIGAVNKNRKSLYLRESLFQLITAYPYAKETKLYLDLQTLLAELTFDDIVESKDDPEDKADRFYQVATSAPAGSEVSKKSLINSVKLGKEERILDRCDRFSKLYNDEFRPGKEVFERCVRLAEHHLRLEREYGFWLQAEESMNESQQLKVGLIEMALDKAKGRKRIQKLKGESAKSALALWDGAGGLKGGESTNPRLEKIQEKLQEFYKTLKPIPFSKIKSIVPGKAKDFEWLDLQLVNFYKSKPNAVDMARSLEMRSDLAARMRHWIKALPEPPTLKGPDLDAYRLKAAEVMNVWEEGAQKRGQECGEVAHTLAMEYKVKNKNVCPDLTPQATFDRFIEKWEATRQKAPAKTPWKEGESIEKGETVEFLLDGGDKNREKDPLRAKYFYIRALDLATTDFERARAYLALARLMNKDVFWEAASALDGNLLEPIQWWRKRAEGNPFYEKLYDKMMVIVK